MGPRLGGAGAAADGRDSLDLPNRKNPNLTVKRVFLPGAELGLTGELPLWAKRTRCRSQRAAAFLAQTRLSGSRRALQRGQAWLTVKKASERANVRVVALRASKHGPAQFFPQI